MSTSGESCRSCNNRTEIFLDLGETPFSNAYLNPLDVAVESKHKLAVAVCQNCWLAQTTFVASNEELFHQNYPYLSGYSSTWINHASKYFLHITEMLKLDKSNFVVEIASNDGTFLKPFIEQGIKCLGIEPTQASAAIAIDRGIETVTKFLSFELSKEIVSAYPKADLIIANNVLAHVPDIADFLRGIENILNDEGVITIEFPHILNLLKQNQFDTVYHEHYSYLSILFLEPICKRYGLRIFRLEELEIHGGSLRVFLCKYRAKHETEISVEQIRSEELNYGLANIKTYFTLQAAALKIKDKFNEYVDERHRSGKIIAGYGAAAKGNTFLNYCGANKETLSFVVDNNPIKQGKLLPGSHIPIVSEQHLLQEVVDCIVILPWNLANEISTSLKSKLSRGKKIEYVTFIPEVKYF